MDPLAEKYSFQSPYAYATNNPVLFRDILGMGVESTHLDEFGNVLKNVDDGVYVYKGATSEADIDKRYSKKNTGAGGTKTGELGGIIHVSTIFKNTMDKNKQIAKRMFNPFAFKALVKDKGGWDLKNNRKTIYGLGDDGKTMFEFGRRLLESQDLGNLHFGVVAKAFGFPLEESLRQAGQAQMRSGTSKPQWQIWKTYNIPGNWKTDSQPKKIRRMLPPNGDDPRDQGWIIEGYKY